MNIAHTFPSDKMSHGQNKSTDADWWRGAVIYQIYPRSFQDTNNDGIGDINGITQRLPYIASLGVDAIWISPFFKSPMLDFGYDVSDYRAVDPMFGTMEDFDKMIATAHDFGLKVMIDQVISHSSDEHDWFRQSRLSKNNEKSDWYVWADAKPDGTPPNNWLSIFGGSAWEWDTSRRQYYLHNYLRSQPDLNFHNIDVQDALLDTVRFWLDRGVDGFRLDTINFYMHDKQLRDNPALPESERNSAIAPDVNPYNYQNHLYDKNQPENLVFLKRFRNLLNEYGAAAVGEVGDAQYGMEIVSQYTSDGDKVQMCYSFDFLSPEPLTAQRVRDVITNFEKSAPTGWSCWAFSNHDVERHASRWTSQVNDPQGFLKMVATVILSLRGSVCLYQGEELGLVESEIAYEDLQDPYGIQFWPIFKGRDGCRTPMVWSHNEENGGFSQSKPWLPVPEEHLINAVNAQEGVKGSLLEYYRALIRVRADHPALIKGAIRFHDAPESVLMFERIFESEVLLVIINMSERKTQVNYKGDLSAITDASFGGILDGKLIKLESYGAFIARLKA